MKQHKPITAKVVETISLSSAVALSKVAGVTVDELYNRATNPNDQNPSSGNGTR